MTWRSKAVPSRTKAVQEWINNDPLRKKYWLQGCPNKCADMLGFKLMQDNKVKEVFCYECETSYFI